MTDTLGPDSTIGGSGTGTVSDDPLIKYRDANSDNFWIAGPGPTGGGQTSSNECVFRDNDGSGTFSAGDTTIFAGSGGGICSTGIDGKDDPKIKYRDADGSGTRTGTELVFYDFNDDGVAEIGTITFTSDIIIYDSVNVFAWQVKVSYDPSKLNVIRFAIGQVWTDSGGSGFPSIDNVAGTAGFGATLTSVASAITNPDPIPLVRVTWRVMNEGASNIHLVTDVEDVSFGIQLLDSDVPGRNILYNTQDGFVSTVGSISPLPDPQFTFVPPNPVSPGSSVAFDASASMDVDAFAWDFGDGTPTVTVSGTMTTHTYAKAGTYTVTVFVTDDEGQNSAPFDPSITVDPEPRLANGKLSWTHHNSGDNEFTAKVQNPSRFAVSVYVQITLVPRDPGLPMLFAYSNVKVLTADSSVQDLVVVVSGSLLSVTKYDLEAVVFYSLTIEPGAIPDGAFPVPLGTPGLIGNVIVSPPGVRFTAPGYASNTVAKKAGAFAQLD